MEVVATRGGSQNVQAVITRAVDIGYGAGLSAVLAAQMQGTDIKIIGSGFIGNSDLFFYVPADSPIKTIDDLKGKIIAYSRPGSVSEVLLRDLSTQSYRVQVRLGRRARRDLHHDHDPADRCRHVGAADGCGCFAQR